MKAQGMETDPRILVIDDDRSVREGVAAYLEDSGFVPLTAENGQEGLAVFRAERPDLILMDLRMPRLDGLDLLPVISAESPETPLVVVSGAGRISDVVESMRRGAWDYLMKPLLDLTVLEHSVRKNLERSRLIRENRRFREELETLVQERTRELEERTRELERLNRRLSEEIRERHEAEKIIRQSLQEKELLLKEVHHRVKNNLQIISSLLSLQSGYVQDQSALVMFQECRNRVRSMALLHERLYKSGDLARIDFRPYVESLATFLFQVYSVSPKDIVLDADIGDGVFLNIETAVPCSLLINELISNSIRHAFRGRQTGRIRVSLHTEDGRARLTIADNGVGFPPGFTLRHSHTLGLKLVTTLVEQLKGNLVLSSEDGVVFAIDFPAQENPSPRAVALRAALGG